MRVSHHKSLLIKIKINIKLLDLKKCNDNNLINKNYMIKKPEFYQKITQNEDQLCNARNCMINKINKNKYFKKLLELEFNHRKIKNIRYSLRKLYINKLYNQFNHILNESLIFNNCIITKKNKNYSSKNCFNNDDIQILIKKYEDLLHTKKDDNDQLIQIEQKLQNLSNDAIERKHQRFIDTAHHYNNNNLEKKLLNHFNDDNDNEAVINYNNKELFSDVDIVYNSMDYIHNLIGKKKSLNLVNDDEKLREDIINLSYYDDHKQESKLFSKEELDYALNHFPNTKSIGLDGKGYQLLKILNSSDLLSNIILKIINKMYLLSTYPELLNVSKLFLLKKRSFIKKFSDFRGITITNNFKNIINYMRFKRNEPQFIEHTNSNHAAYKKGIGCEITMYGMSVAINKLTSKNKKLYMAISDLNKAFDNLCRNGIILTVYKSGISGRNLRLLSDELNNTKCEIVYNGIHSLQIKISEGAPQGHNEGGHLYNIYTNPTLKGVLSIIKTYVYDTNISAVYYADDGMKVALNIEDLQNAINIESHILYQWNLDTNPTKSKIVKFTTSKKIKENIFNKELDLIMNGEKLKWDAIKSNIINFIGFDLNFNIRNYMKYHLKQKLIKFKYLKKKLYFNNTLGGGIDIEIQTTLYKVKIRMAMIFGLKSIFLNQTDYKELNSLQKKYLSTIIGGGQKMENMSMRILLGILQLSDFIIKLKLSMYYDIFRTNKDVFSGLIKKNYIEAFDLYIKNNNSYNGIHNKWIYPTYDYIQCSETWNIDRKYLDIHNLQSSRNEWIKIINRNYKKIYQKELDQFLSNNGRLFTMIFGLSHFMEKYRNKIYSGFIDELRILMITTYPL